MHRTSFTTIALALASALTAANPVAASCDITNVDQGTTHPTIQDAVDNANSGDTIQLGACTYNERNIEIYDAITIKGAGAGQTFIDGQNLLGTILKINAPGAEVLVEDLSIVNGVADTSPSGGGAYVFASVATFRNCEFDGNDANTHHAGVLSVGVGGHAILERCIVKNSVSGVTAIQQAGPLDLLTCINSLFVSNNTDFHILGHHANVPLLINCTFADSAGMTDSVFRADAHNCVFDTPPSTTTATRCVFAGATGDNIDATPTFVDAPSGDFRLAAGSPGIDAADSTMYIASSTSPLDIAGNGRLADDSGTPDTGTGAPSYLDAGAFENHTDSTGTACEGDANGDGVVDANDLSYVIFRFGACP